MLSILIKCSLVWVLTKLSIFYSGCFVNLVLIMCWSVHQHMACTRVRNHILHIHQFYPFHFLFHFDFHILCCMYLYISVCAAINDVEVLKVPLTPHFDVNLEATLAGIKCNTKMVFLCSPGRLIDCFEMIISDWLTYQLDYMLFIFEIHALHFWNFNRQPYITSNTK